MTDQQPPNDETAAWNIGPRKDATPTPRGGNAPKSSKREGAVVGNADGTQGAASSANPSAPTQEIAGAEQDFGETPRAEGLRFIRELGRGGLGSVWLAVQETAEFRRNVAVKLVRRGMDTEDILRRFALERQLLAALEHPNIVRLYDAGTTADGRPYFAMEYVEGLPIDRYADERQLGIDKRLELFVQVCRAVQYAHTKLVIHRDLKPSNIIVARDGTVKLLDFGIAKLVDSALSPVQLDPTSAETRVLTPEYASPEQIRGQTLSTASDVYSLGVILFELLTGHRPYRIRTRLMREMERIVCEEEPQVPSTMVGKPAESIIVETSANGETKVVSREIAPQMISKARAAATDTLRRKLRGDLDVITLRALAKTPDTRYPTAEALAQDVMRHMRGEPIEARPLGWTGKAYRFVKRNRIGVGVSVLALSAVIGGLGSAYYAERAASESALRVAETARAQAEADLRAAQEKLAGMRLEQVRELSGVFLNQFYNRLRALQGGAELRGLLADTVSRQVAALEKQDAVVGSRVADQEFDRLLASSYRGLGRVRGDMRGESGGDFTAAKEAFVKSESILKAMRRRDDVMAKPEIARSVDFELMQTYLLWADAVKAAGDLDEAKRLLFEAEALGAANAAVSSRDERQRHASVLTELGEILDRQGDRGAAETMFARSIELRRANVAAAPTDLDAVRALGKGIASLQSRAEASGEWAKALQLAEELTTLRVGLSRQKPDDARLARDAMLARMSLGRALLRNKRADEAVEALQAACAEATTRVERTPESHEALSDRAIASESLGQALDELRRYDDALKRWAMARADLRRAAEIAPTVVGYQRREAYFGGREARTLALAGRAAEGAPIGIAAATFLNALVGTNSTDMDLLLQAAIVSAEASTAARVAGDESNAVKWEARAIELLGLMTPQARAANERFVRAELELLRP
ncbi:MAG: serine/threonine-protein kinase [Limnohabitans sp.]|nr:serine/threonine-protein kinase [Limnohabitans sp.]